MSGHEVLLFFNALFLLEVTSVHEDEAKGNDDRHAWGCGDEKKGTRGGTGGGIGAGEAPISNSSLVHLNRGQDGCTVKWELQSERTGTYMPDLREFPFSLYRCYIPPRKDNLDDEIGLFGSREICLHAISDPVVLLRCLATREFHTRHLCHMASCVARISPNAGVL